MTTSNIEEGRCAFLENTKMKIFQRGHSGLGLWQGHGQSQRNASDQGRRARHGPVHNRNYKAKTNAKARKLGLEVKAKVKVNHRIMKNGKLPSVYVSDRRSFTIPISLHHSYFVPTLPTIS